MTNIFPTDYIDKTTPVAGDKLWGYDSEAVDNKNFTIGSIGTTIFGLKNTGNLSEGTNLYYTAARVNAVFDTKLAAADTDDLSEGTTNKYASTTNVNAAGATMNADTTLAGNGYFLDEDDMSSDSAIKVPSQQSVKKYVDDNVGISVDVTLETRDIQGASGTVQYSHSLGKIPKLIQVNAEYSSASLAIYSKGSWITGNSNKSVYYAGAVASNSTTYAIYCKELDADGQVGIINNVTSTTFDVVWTYTATPAAATIQLMFTLML